MLSAGARASAATPTTDGGVSTIRSLAIAALAACLVAIPGAAIAAGGDPGEGDADGTVTIDGRTFGPEDGLVIDPGSATVSGPRATSPRIATDTARSSGAVTPQIGTGDLTKYSWGTSYASSQESNFLWYYAKARAMANLYSSKRVVAVTVGYSLCRNDGSRYNSPRVTSNASSNGSRWYADSTERVLKVSDNATAPSTCKTLFNKHDASLISPNIF